MTWPNWFTALLLVAAAACNEPAPAPPDEAPAAVLNPLHGEGDLARVRLTEEAEKRLAIQTATVDRHHMPSTRRVGGEVVIPPGRAFQIAAPVAGIVRPAKGIEAGSHVADGGVLLHIVPLAPVERDTRARATREVAAADANFAAAEARVARAQTLVQARAGSQKAVEEAIALRDIAGADRRAARARAAALKSSPMLSDVAITIAAPEAGVVRSLSMGDGQAVAAGAPLIEIVATTALWVRVPLHSGDLHRIDTDATAAIEPLGGTSNRELGESLRPIAAKAVAGPPTSSPLGTTVDRYFSLEGSTAALAPGERVMVELPLRESTEVWAVPMGAVLYDASGAAWLYVCEGDHVFRRSRIDVVRRHGDLAVINRGPAVGTCVVSVGAAELFGTEFEPGH